MASYLELAGASADLPAATAPSGLARLAVRGACAWALACALAGCNEEALRGAPDGGPSTTSSSFAAVDRTGGTAARDDAGDAGSAGGVTGSPDSAAACQRLVARRGRLELPERWPASEPAAHPIDPATLSSYQIDQTIDLAAGEIRGRLLVDFPNPATEPLTVVPLLLHANASRELGASAESSPSIEVTSVELVAPPDGVTRGRALDARAVRPTLLEARLPSPVAPGERARLLVRYVARPRQLAGTPNDMLAQSAGALGTLGPNAPPQDYGLLAVGDGLLTAALAYPVVAPYRDGSFDTGPPSAFGDVAYASVARFAVRTVLPAGVTAVSNLLDEPIAGGAEGEHLLCSAGSLVRDFVLVAGSDLERKSVELGPVRVTSVFRARDGVAGQQVLDDAASALGVFERHFGPYPYAELDVVESSLVGGAGGVEFSALVLVAGMLYRSPADSSHPFALVARLSRSVDRGIGALRDFGSLFGAEPPEVEPGAATPDGGAPSGPAPPPDPFEWLEASLGTMREFTVAHEVAHQYFAGIVGNDSRRHPSLDEPLAQYAARVAIEARHGPEAGERAWDANVTMNYALYRLLDGPDRAVLRDIAGFKSALEYTALVYGKAPQVYPALRTAIGADALHRAMRAAIARHRFGLLTTEQWIAAIVEGAGPAHAQVRPLFDRWLRKTLADADLGIEPSGKRLLELAFGREQGAAMREAFAALGMSPRELFRLTAGGGLGP